MVKIVEKIPFSKKHKILYILIILLIILLFTASGAKIYLFVNFLLGNDIIVKLEVDKEILPLIHNQEENITFKAKVTTNPFCTAQCESTFTNINDNQILKNETFKLIPGKASKRNYLIKSTNIGTGIDLYKFSMDCHSIRSLLCHTSEVPTTRNILIIVNRSLTEAEKELKNKLNELIGFLLKRQSNLHGKQVVIDQAIQELNQTLNINQIIKENLEIKNISSKLLENVKDLQETWDQQDYFKLEKGFYKANSDITQIEARFSELNNNLSNKINQYNLLITDLTTVKDQLTQLKNQFTINESLITQINDVIKKFNQVISIFQTKNDFTLKQNSIREVASIITSLSFSIKEVTKKQALEKELSLNVNYDLICNLTGNCIQHPSIQEHSDQTTFELNQTCSKINNLRNLYKELNISIQNISSAQNYPNTTVFSDNISLKFNNLKQNIINNYLTQVPGNSQNTELIKEILTQKPLATTGNYSQYNLSPILTTKLIENQPKACKIINTLDIQNIQTNKITIQKSTSIPLNITFKNPQPICCVFSECKECCTTDKCHNNPKMFPIVFIHGHAFNKDTSADYSLDAFNKIQRKLEQDGYLNAGAISLYTGFDTPGIWGLPNVPVTIKASYYFDIFKQPENYIVVQTKSENINTYALRLKELIETIQFKTKKPKVTIIAHSMGGLVARRYMQIFENHNIHKLITIATPNKGIQGSTADYCPIIGEKLECRDMNSDSLFMNKLSIGKQPDIPMHSIIGTGCIMDTEIGDGVVFEQNAELENAKNYLINGTCSKLDTLHTQILDTDLYPKVYTIIKDALQE